LRARKLLDAAVDGQMHGRAVLRRCERARVRHHAAQTIADHLALARFAREQFVGGELDAFLAVVLDVGEADHVRRRFALGIKALRIRNARDAREVELVDMRGRFRIDLALEQHEALVAGYAVRELGKRHIEELRQRRMSRFVEQLRRSPDFVCGETDGQHRAIAVDDAPARRIEFDGALIALLPLFDVEVLIDDLHPERAADQRSERREHEDHDQLRAPHGQARDEDGILRDGRVRIVIFLADHEGEAGRSDNRSTVNVDQIVIRT
jgi:hypothetical protein